MVYTFPIFRQAVPSASTVNYMSFTNGIIVWDTDPTISKNVMGGDVATTFSNFTVKLTNAPGTGKSYQFELLVNEVSKASVTISDSATTATDSTVVTLNPSNRYQVKCTPSGTPAATGNQQYSVLVNTGSSNNQCLSIASNSIAIESSNTTTFCSLDQRGTQVSLPEYNAQWPWPNGGTLSYMYVDLQNDPGSGQTCTVTLMQNGNPTGITCVITGDGSTHTTGSDVNPAHAVTVTAGDLMDYKVVISNGATSTRSRIGIRFSPTIDGEVVYLTEAGLGSAATINVTGEAVTLASNTAANEMSLKACTVKNLYAVTLPNNSPASTKTLTLTFQQNATNTSLGFVITGTGVANSILGSDTNSGHNVTISDGDGEGVNGVTSSGTGVVVFHASFVMLFSQPSLNVSNSLFMLMGVG